MGPPQMPILVLNQGMDASEFMEKGTYRGEPADWAGGYWLCLVATTAALHDGGKWFAVLFEDLFVAVPATQRGFFGAWLLDAPARVPVEGRIGCLCRRISS